jgi:hypothetical protein
MWPVWNKAFTVQERGARSGGLGQRQGEQELFISGRPGIGWDGTINAI